jgi:hypothetical protein
VSDIMFAQVLLGGCMHVWDVLSDVYVIYLWHVAGRTSLVAAGIFFLVLSPAVTAVLGPSYLRGDGGRFSHLIVPYALLAPLNLHNMIFGYLVLHDKAEPLWYDSFTFLKAMHAGIESTPFLLMTGIDLLTGGDAIGGLVKWTSLGLSVFSVCFSLTAHICSVVPCKAERVADMFVLLALDTVMAIIAMGWTVAALSLSHAAIAIACAYGVVWIGIVVCLVDFVDPSKETVTVEMIRDTVRPYCATFGFSADALAKDVKGRKAAVTWVVPFISFVSTMIGGAVPILYDPVYVLPEPAATLLRTADSRTLEPAVALVRRLAIAALCILHLAARFSWLRFGVTVGCGAAHTYFTLRCRDVIGGTGIILLACRCLQSHLLLVCHLLLSPVAVASVLFAPRVHLISDAHNSSNSVVHSGRKVKRPLGCSGEELAFFDLCDAIWASEEPGSAASQSSACSSARALYFLAGWCGYNTGKVAQHTEGVVTARQTLLLELQGCAEWACTERPKDRLQAATKVLQENFTPSMSDAGKMKLCIAALGALQKGTVETAPAEVAEITIDPGDIPSFLAVKFRTVADPAVWRRDYDTGSAFELATKVAPSEEADFFLSHAWGDDGDAKAAVLRTFLFLQPFVAVTTASSVMFALTFIPGGFILAELDHRIPWWSLSVASLGIGACMLLWAAVCHFCGVRLLVPWRWSSLRLWFDKCCIDQNSDASKKAGIDHLGDSLQRCRCMLVVFSETYLERLWCTYELATYCRLMSSDTKHAEAAAQASSARLGTAEEDLARLAAGIALLPSPELDKTKERLLGNLEKGRESLKLLADAKSAARLSDKEVVARNAEGGGVAAEDVPHTCSPKTLKFLALDWSPWWHPANMTGPVALSPEEQRLLLGFRCSDAKCWRRADREIVLGLICEAWGSEDAFDAYVREQLPAILLKAKQEYYTQARSVMWDSFVTMFT